MWGLAHTYAPTVITELAAEVRIAAPAERVWEVVGSTARYSEWVVNTLEVTRADGPRADVGVTYDERNRIAGPWTARSTWRVVSADPPRHTLHEGSGIALVKWLRLEIGLEPDGDAATRYRHVLSYEPALRPLGPVLDRLLRPGLRRDVQETVQRLRRLVEAES